MPAKVYIWTLGGKAGSVGAWANVGSVQVRILRWMQTGEMPEIATSDEYGNVSVGDGYDKVIVIVTGNVEEFGIGFFKMKMNLPIPSPSSGGKG
jgi:hypothetical protein